MRFRSPKDIDVERRELRDPYPPPKADIVVSHATCARARGSQAILDAFRREIERKGLGYRVNLKVTGCHGFCEVEPNVVVGRDHILYRSLQPEDVPEILDRTVIAGETIERLLYSDPMTKKTTPKMEDIPFYRKQMRNLLAANLAVDPRSLPHYIASGGYSALGKALCQMKPEEIIDEVLASGIRGRGGAGFPTGVKWGFARKAPGDRKYIVCNADEGDPGAYMDRSLLEGNPHSVIEGMIIGAFAIGAQEGYIYVRDEYPLAVEHVTLAIDQAREAGLLGHSILGSELDFDIKISRGAGAFVCGEETALMWSIEGHRGEPRQRPPFPAVKGLWGKPTNINNVETWANIPLIINRGGDWFASIGTEKSKGTKIFSLVGKINNTGLVEVPMGITLGEIIYDIGGGIPQGRRFKAVQTGGPSGGCIPTDFLNLPVDYDSLAEAGSIMGSGGMVVMDENTCMVDVARYFLNFLKDESCGKCFSCREGIQRMLDIVTDICSGRGALDDLDLLAEVANTVKMASMCGLGQTAANPVLSTLRYFRSEYEDHIIRKRCEAGVCNELVSAPCQHACPVDQEAGTYVGLIANGDYAKAVEIIRKDNPLPWVCSRACFHPCEVRCRAGQGGEPVSIRALKRFVMDWAWENNAFKPIQTEAPKEKTIAVVGSGPAGLACAFYLTRMGYQVTVFEALSVVGGMLAAGVPHHRLPPEILQRDIDGIKELGVKIKTGVKIGTDDTIDGLLEQGYHAVFLAVGTHKSWNLKISGEDADGVLHGLDIVQDVSLGRPRPKVGKKIVIIGGGSVAVDAARVLRRMAGRDFHSGDITIMYRRTRAEMPAYPDEVDAAIEEGVAIDFLTAPTEVITQNGRVTGLKCVRMYMGPVDDTGRRRPVPIEGSEFVRECDTLVPAIGEFPDLTVLEGTGHKFEITKWSTIVVDPETQATGEPGVFAGGDFVTGPSTIVEAMSQGKRAALAIARFLAGEPMTPDYEVTRPWMYVEPVELTEEEILCAKRPKMPLLPADQRALNFEEVELGLSEEASVREARRCLRCEFEVKDKVTQDELKARRRKEAALV